MATTQHLLLIPADSTVRIPESTHYLDHVVVGVKLAPVGMARLGNQGFGIACECGETHYISRIAQAEPL